MNSSCVEILKQILHDFYVPWFDFHCEQSKSLENWKYSICIESHFHVLKCLWKYLNLWNSRLKIKNREIHISSSKLFYVPCFCSHPLWKYQSLFFSCENNQWNENIQLTFKIVIFRMWRLRNSSLLIVVVLMRSRVAAVEAPLSCKIERKKKHLAIHYIEFCHHEIINAGESRCPLSHSRC